MNYRYPVCLTLTGAMLSFTKQNSPGPVPAPEPEMLPSDLSSDWPTTRKVGMVNMTGEGGKEGVEQ